MSETLNVRVTFPAGLTPYQAKPLLEKSITALEREFGSQVSGRPIWRDHWNCDFSISESRAAIAGRLAIDTEGVTISGTVELRGAAAMFSGTAMGKIRTTVEQHLRQCLGYR